MDTLYIEYENDADKIIAPEEKINTIASLVSTMIHSRPGEVSISFVSKEKMRILNKEYRDIDESTDILSFVQEEDVEEPFFAISAEAILGDLVISLPDMLQNCQYFNVDKDNELIRLIVHGFLHLNGHDHMSNDESEEMLQLQENIVNRIEKELDK